MSGSFQRSGTAWPIRREQLAGPSSFQARRSDSDRARAFGLFGQNAFVTSTAGESYFAARRTIDGKFPTEQFFSG